MDQNPTGFASEDEEATYCLSLLRDGDRNQKVVARERLSQIFEQRGMLDEAAQCLESNIREGIRDPRVYQRLAGVYRRQGRHELADEVLLEARRLAERMSRSGPAGGRRAGRPGRGAPTPPPATQDVSTRQMPAPNLSAARFPEPATGGEFGMDQPDFAGSPRIADTGERPVEPVADRPSWLSPAMVVLLILVCGPYGLALMWVRGNYPLRARRTAIAVWAGLTVLMLAAVSVTAQSTFATMIAASTGLPSIARSPGVPTPIAFPPASGATGAQQSQKPSSPIGAAPSPPVIEPPAGGRIGAPPGVIIAPGSPVVAGAPPSASPAAAAAKPTAAAPPPTAKPASGERVKVVNTGDQGANMRERAGATAPVVKTVPEGAVLEIIGADQQMDGRGWRHVREEGGAEGWIVAELLGAP